MTKLYAWTTIPTEFSEWGTVTKKITPGQEVKREDVTCTDQEWDEYVERGLVSEQKYPEAPENVSPNEYYSSKTSVEMATLAQTEAEEAHAQLEAAAEAVKAQTQQEASKGATGATGATDKK